MGAKGKKVGLGTKEWEPEIPGISDNGCICFMKSSIHILCLAVLCIIKGKIIIQ